MSTEKKPLNVQIGARIKQAREQAHVTQERLAEQIEVSVQYISDLERGKVGASVSTVIKSARRCRSPAIICCWAWSRRGASTRPSFLLI